MTPLPMICAVSLPFLPPAFWALAGALVAGGAALLAGFETFAAFAGLTLFAFGATLRFFATGAFFAGADFLVGAFFAGFFLAEVFLELAIKMSECGRASNLPGQEGGLIKSNSIFAQAVSARFCALNLT
ncbi:MAG: hypothetical protein ABI233_11730 [Chthoniobacterales bacterium]